MRWWHGLLFFVLAMAAQLSLSVGLVAALQLFGWLGQDAADPIGVLFSPSVLSLQVTTTCAMLAGLALFVPRAFRLPSGRFLAIVPARPALLALSVLGIGAVGFLSDEAVFLLHRAMPERFDLSNLNAFGEVFSSSGFGAFVAVTAVVVIGPALGEELFFRGLLLRSFARSLPGWLAVALSAGLFGVLHLDPLQGFGAALIGLFLGYVVLASGSLWPAVIAHGFNNLLCSLFARYASQLPEDAWEQGHPPEILIPSLVIAAGSLYGIHRLSGRTRAPAVQTP